MNENICEGCLSVNRNLKIVDEKNRKLFYSCLDLDYENSDLQLCWECRAMLKRFLRFKQQVKQAQETLTSYMLHQIPFISLSNLTTTKLTKEIIYTENIKQPTQPLAFVKFEDEIGCNDGCNDSCDDNDFDKRESSVIDLKADPIDGNLKNYDGTKTDNPTDIENKFSESDDEPLKQIKNEKRLKERINNKRARVKKRLEVNVNAEAEVVSNARVNKKLQELNVGNDLVEMVILSWEEVESERQRALSSDTFTRHEYRCYHCAVGFNHRCKLDDHMKKHDPASGSAECPVCRVRCRDKHALTAHKRRHRVRWRCKRCGAAWSRAAVCADHVAREHGGPRPTHTCSVCGHVETSLGKLRNHIKNHSERQKCELCGKTFRDRTSLRTHLFIHKGEKEYECPRCKKKFLFKKAMEIHLVTHDESAHLYCHLCDMNFKNQMSYNQHIKYNLKHVDPSKLKYACKLCDKKFVKATRLEEHNLAIHLKVTPITCAVPGCSFACSSRPVLRTHMRMLHRNARLNRNHVCDVCGKTYTTKKSLEGHLRSHTGERPFRCAACPAAFGYEAALYNHNKLVHLRPKCDRRGAEWSLAPHSSNDLS